MNPNSRYLMRSAVLALTACLLLSSADADKLFHTGTFGEVSVLAKKEGKWLMIDFTAEWCGPCKMLDKTTWQDPEVIDLVLSKAYAIKVDVDEQKALKRQYKISAMPTIVFLDQSGLERDRILGYKNAETFKRSFSSLMDGKTSLDIAREKFETADAESPNNRVEYGRAFLNSGYPAEALEQFLWAWENGRKEEEFRGIRRSFLLADIFRLSRSYPPAAEAYESLLRKARAAWDSQQNKETLMELYSLYDNARRGSDTLALFDGISGVSPLKAILGNQITSVLYEAKRYAEMLEYADVDERLAINLKRYRSFENRENSETALSSIKNYTVHDLGRFFKALLMTDQTDRAVSLARSILEFDDSEETRKALDKIASSSGFPELVSAL